MYDAIVVGARCAGSPTAMLLAREGYKVLMLDKASFPSDTMSGHYIHQPGVVCLERWGVLDAVLATNCPPISRLSFDVGDFALTGSPPPADGVSEALCCRRHLLDKILVDAAVAAGAELREGTGVEDLVFEDGSVVGIRTSVASGSVTERARIVIGADGAHSLVARLVDAPVYNETAPLSFGYYTYWSGYSGPRNLARFLPRGDRTIGVLPTNDDKTLIFYQAPIDQFHAHRTDIEGHYMEAISRDPQLVEHLAGATHDRFAGTADLPNFFRRPYGNGWALVGDAGYHKDPITGQGITDAFHCAEMLADAIDAGFCGRQPLDEAMAQYEQRRNELVMPIFQMTCDFARCEPPPPEMQALIGAIRGNQPAIDAFLGCLAGTTPIPQFFSEENVGRLMMAAMA